jgi:phospholipase C
MIAVFPFSKGGHIKHSYTEHSSIVKFVERNRHLGTLTDRSCDNLPNLKADDDNLYLPVNMPAIGDRDVRLRSGQPRPRRRPPE